MKFIVVITCLLGLGLALHYMRLFFLRLPKTFWPHLPMLAAILFYCAGGTLLAYGTLPQAEMEQLFLWRRIGDEHILAALLITLSFAVFVHWLASRLHAYVSLPSQELTGALDRLSLDSLAFFFTSIVILGGYGALAATGRVSFHGAANTQSADPNATGADPLLIVAQQALSLLPLLCGYRLLERGKLWYTVLVLLATTGFALTQGRQQLVILLFLVLTGVILNRRIKITRAITGALIASLLAVALLGFFVSVAVRMATWYSPRGASGVQVAALALDLLVKGGQDQKTSVAAQTQSNADSRAFNPIEFLASLTSADRSHLGSFGEAFVNGFENAVPSVFWRDKDRYHREEEEIAATTFNVPIAYDEAETIMSGGYLDFREPGVLLNGLLVLLLFMAVLSMIKRARLPAMKLLTLCVLLFTALEPEAAMLAWFLLLRSTLALFLIDLFLQTFQSQPRAVGGCRPSQPTALLPDRTHPGFLR